MPIYAYRCDHCGLAKDVLQKISDAPLTDCPSCGTAGAFKKQLTAAGFQLKGSGWYVTDFRGGNSAPAKSGDAASTSASTATSTDGGGSSGGSDASASSAAAPATSAPAKSGS